MPDESVSSSPQPDSSPPTAELQPPSLQPARSPLRELIAIAGPTVATMTSYTAMTFTDKWLVSRLDPELVGAQGNGGLASWVPQAFMYGTLQVINTYVSQNMGAGKASRGAAYAWNGIFIAAAFSLLLQPYALLLPWIFEKAAMDPAQAGPATEYGRILIWGCFLNMATRALGQFFYGLHKAGIVMIAGILANIVNLVVSAMLVFGQDTSNRGLGLFGEMVAWLSATVGLERGMGIAGSAWGTVIATGVELSIPLAFFLSAKMHRQYGTRTSWRLSWPHIRDILRIGWPGGAMFANEMICWGFFMVYLVSHHGKAHASAGWITHQYMSLSFMPAVGMSVATTAIVGKYIGAGRHDLAAARYWLALGWTVAYMGLCALIFVVFRHQLIALFVKDGTPPEEVAELVRLGSMMLIATATFQIFDAGAMVTSGALRGAGDTLFPGVATIVSSWLIIVGGGFALLYAFPGLESLGAWMAASAYIIVLCLLLLGRFLAGHWKTIKLLPGSAPAPAGDGVTDGITPP